MSECSNAVSSVQSFSFSTACNAQPSLVVSSVFSGHREAVEYYIATIFKASYGAQLSEFLPLILSLECEGQPSAALGLRSAAFESLFSERYLDAPVELAIEQIYGQRCRRAQIMELGNLVATTPRHSALLYILVVAAMHAAGITYSVFVANRKVRASVKRCGFTPQVICQADADCLGHKQQNWGSYYDGNPQLMVADIALTMAQAKAQPAIAKQLDYYQSSIQRLAALIQGAEQ